MTERAERASTPSRVIAQGLFSYQIGGSERVGADIAIEFKRRGYEVVCFAFYDSDGPVRQELEAHGIPCVDLNYETRRRPWRRVTYAFEFYRFIKRWNVDALVVHHATALILCGIAARFAGVRRTVMIEHAIHQLRERPRYRRSAMRYMRYADVITGVDEGIVRYFRDEMAVDERKLRYLPNGVSIRHHDEETRTRTRTALGLAPEEFVFLFVGRLQAVKDVATLLAAAAHLPEPLSASVRLVIAGDGPERQALERQADELGIRGRVLFLGFRSDVDDLLAAADAFIMTSVTEGQPMALIEAMAARVPCVATSVGGIPDLLRDGGGILVPPSESSEIAEAMRKIATSPDLRASCVRLAEERIRKDHSLERVAGAYLQELGFAG